ncbi:MAG: multicopper oxidase family protein [Cyanosarcina radialis HA8281-LM2]|nr:multicopper oxidase family protein [Cyanosarcina radialis HA8281-LM2]
MKLRRRHFLALGAASAGGVLLSRWAIGQKQISPSAILTERYRNALAYKSQDGLLEMNLEAGNAVVRLGDRQAHLLSYNGQVPAPRLEAKPGDTVRIHFRNKLSEPTNLHYHGLHVTPTGKGDNAFLSIPPNERLTYEFKIPTNHPAGTFWYHPHHHGHVAEQVFGGLAGLFIVRGDLDEIPEVKAAREQFLVLQDFALNADGRIEPPNHMAMMMGREGSLVTANGQVNPTLAIASGGLLRLRLLNASPSRFYRLALEDHPLYLIASDGGAIAQPVELRELLLTPGERAEVLVKGDRPAGQYRLLNLPYDRGGMGMMGNEGMMPGMGGMRHNQGSQSPQPLATLTYRESTTSLPLPKKLMAVESLPKPGNTRRIELSMAMAMGTGMVFLFNGQTFDPQRIDASVSLGTVEDWELVNADPDRMDHPFHLHINPFQVISRNGQPEPYPAWKDTVLVKGGETVRIRVPFRDFTGKTVYHCHVLDHEDLGMMGTLEIGTRSGRPS